MGPSAGARADPFNNVARYNALMEVVLSRKTSRAFAAYEAPKDPSYKRWKKSLDQIMSWDGFDPRKFMTDTEIDRWIKTMRHKVMYGDESRVD